ncbi:hypothetical protein DAI22_08g141300 [Oryza sativa Japonica Group]|nr:hypothetical protein DAI22_08g141300 [Oryza sativa Japonica Group]
MLNGLPNRHVRRTTIIRREALDSSSQLQRRRRRRRRRRKPEVVQRRPPVEPLAVVVRQELPRRRAPVHRRRPCPAAADDDRDTRPRRRVRVAEEARHRHAGRPRGAGGQHPVLHAPEPVVRHQLEEVADVHHQRAGHRGHVHPPLLRRPREHRLQAAGGVLQQHCEEAGVGVLGRAHRRLRLRARRVVVRRHAQAQPVHAPGVAAKVPHGEAQRLRQQLEQPFPEPPHRRGVHLQHAPARRRDLFRRGRLREHLNEHRVAPVGLRRTEPVTEEAEVGVEPDLAGDVPGVVGHLRLQGLLVEAPHRREHLLHQLPGDAMVDHLEEADRLRGRPDLGDHPSPVDVGLGEVDVGLGAATGRGSGVGINEWALAHSKINSLENHKSPPHGMACMWSLVPPCLF